MQMLTKATREEAEEELSLHQALSGLLGPLQEELSEDPWRPEEAGEVEQL